MKTKLCFGIILLSLLFSVYEKTNAQTPNWLWAKRIGGTGQDLASSVAVDPAGSGDVYTTGSFSGTVDFDPDSSGSFNLTAAGSNDIFISKLNASGHFVWAKAMDGSTGNSSGQSIALDPGGSGDVYTAGYFGGTVDFDPDSSASFNLTSAGNADIFISKLDGSGNFVWAKRMGGTSFDHGLSLALDPSGSGDVYTIGYFQGTVDFDPGAGVTNLTSAGGDDIFISKLNAAGNFVWAKRIGGAGDDDGLSIALDPVGSGNVYTTGSFTGTVDFNPGTGVFNLTSPGYNDIFICKLDSAGNLVWAKTMGGSGSAYGLSIALDSAGNGSVYTTGFFYGTVDFDPGGGVSNLSSVGGSDDVFISKLDTAGNFVWARAMGGSGINGEFGNSIAIDRAGSGDVYTTGSFGATADFDPGAGTFNLSSAGDMDIFISKLDASGNFVWAKAVGGTSYDEGLSVALDPVQNGEVHLAGWFFSTSIAFGSINLVNADNTGSNPDLFITRLNDVATGIASVKNDNGISVFPNPASYHFTINLGSTCKKVDVTITDITGKIIYTVIASEIQELECNIPQYSVTGGVYFLRIQGADFIETKKLMLAE